MTPLSCSRRFLWPLGRPNDRLVPELFLRRSAGSINAVASAADQPLPPAPSDRFSIWQVNSSDDDGDSELSATDRPKSLRKWPMVIVVLIGALLVGASFFVESHWGWQGVAPSALLEFGAAFALASVLFVAERSFERSVERSVESATAATKQEIREELTERIEEQSRTLSARISDLEGLRRDREDGRFATQDQLIRSLEAEVTRDGTISLLEQANDLQAFAGEGIEVYGSAGSDSINIEFSWGWRLEEIDHPDWPGRTSEAYILRLLAEVSSDVGHGSAQVEWRDDMPPDEFGDQIVQDLRRHSMWPGPEAFDLSHVFSSLVRSLDVATQARQGRGSEWTIDNDQVVRMVGRDWLVGGTGLTLRNHGRVIERRQAENRLISPETWPPPPPAGVDPEQWQFGVHLAEQTWHAPASADRAIHFSRPVFSDSGPPRFVPKGVQDGLPREVSDLFR